MRRVLVIAAVVVALILYRNWSQRAHRRELFECRIVAAGDPDKLRRCLRRAGWNERAATTEYFSSLTDYITLLDATVGRSDPWKMLQPAREPRR
jgi:hypothetical protein